MSKTCRECGITKPLTEFYELKGPNHGPNSRAMYCRACTNHKSWRVYATKRDYWIEQLGGECVQCGETESLHFHHIDGRFKTRDITAMLSKMREDDFEFDIQYIELLCASCHKKHHVKAPTFEEFLPTI
jgi:hypothetical protein